MSSPRLLSLAAGVVPEFDPVATITAAAAAGFGASGIWVEVAEWTDATTAKVRRRLDDTGLVALDAEVVRIGGGRDPAEGRRIIEIAAEVGALNLLCISLDPDPVRTAEVFADLCRAAAPAGIRCVMEFMRFTAIRSLAEAVAVVRAAGEANGGVLVDALHLDRCGDSASALRRLPADLFPYAQLCDAPAQGPTDEDALRDEALDGRLLPGDGELPLHDLLDALRPGLPLSMEVRSAALRSGFPDAVERARAVYDATTRLLSRTGLSQTGPAPADRATHRRWR